jgi:hypothetical protein
MLRFIFRQNVFLAAALAVSVAFAEPSEADRATARELATAGYHALKRKEYAIAADRFQRADALVHAPTLVVDWARALTGLGLLVEAQERYELVLREGVASNAPRAWRRALDDAKAELEALKPRIAWLTLVVTGPERPTVTVDRSDLPEAALGVPRATNPGTRKIRVEAPGYVPETRSIALAEGAQQRLEITMVPRPPEANAPTPLPLVQQRRPVPAPKDDESGAQRGIAYAALTVGGAGLVVGGVTGALALHKRSKLESACSGGSCPPNERETIDAYHRLGTASGIGFGVALVGIGTGVTLLLTDDSGPSTGAGPKELATKPRPNVRPYVGFGTAGAVGSF